MLVEFPKLGRMKLRRGQILVDPSNNLSTTHFGVYPFTERVFHGGVPKIWITRYQGYVRECERFRDIDDDAWHMHLWKWRPMKGPCHEMISHPSYLIPRVWISIRAPHEAVPIKTLNLSPPLLHAGGAVEGLRDRPPEQKGVSHHCFLCKAKEFSHHSFWGYYLLHIWRLCV